MDQVRNNKNFEIKKCFPKVSVFSTTDEIFSASNTHSLRSYISDHNYQLSQKSSPNYLPTRRSFGFTSNLPRSVQICSGQWDACILFIIKCMPEASQSVLFPKSHRKTHNSVKYEVIWEWYFVMLIQKERWISLTTRGWDLLHIYLATSAASGIAPNIFTTQMYCTYLRANKILNGTSDV